MRMKEMNKSTLAALGIAVGLVVLALGLLIGMWAGCSTIFMTQSFDGGQGGGNESAETLPPVAEGEAINTTARKRCLPCVPLGAQE
jgi:hypothetical protein